VQVYREPNKKLSEKYKYPVYWCLLGDKNATPPARIAVVLNEQPDKATEQRQESDKEVRLGEMLLHLPSA
jgi:hypothetical protein